MIMLLTVALIALSSLIYTFVYKSSKAEKKRAFYFARRIGLSIVIAGIIIGIIIGVGNFQGL